jgi:hypothetical protein
LKAILVKATILMAGSVFLWREIELNRPGLLSWLYHFLCCVTEVKFFGFGFSFVFTPLR